MMRQSVDTIYTSCSCNRTPHSVDWGRNGLIIYGVCNAVALYDPKYADAGKVLATFCYHKGRVNSVCWVKQEDGSEEVEFISTSCDGTAVVWMHKEDCIFYPCAVLEGHQDVVSIASGMYTQSRTGCVARRPMIVATGSVDSTVKVWNRPKNEEVFSCIQTLSFGTGFCVHIQMDYLPHSTDAFLVCASDDAKLYLFVKDSTDFVKVDYLVGHKDCVQALDITTEDSGDLLLASGSQDSMIRLWRLSSRKDLKAHRPVSELAAVEDIELEEQVFSVAGRHYAVVLESVLAGHEDWIYGISWHPGEFSKDGTKLHQPMKLLSSSLDKSMAIWEPETSSGVWVDTMRVGDASGNLLGYYGSKFGPNGLSIMGHGYQGTFHMWEYHKDKDLWEPGVPMGGHFDEVVDLQWEPHGQFVLTVSKDQTTRLHAPWIHSEDQKQVTWHELARPQVHGHDMTCLAVLSRYRFASGAEEKVIRAFQAPQNFIKNFRRLCNVRLDQYNENTLGLPHGAAVTALGLSNKAVFNEEIFPEDSHVKDRYPAANFVAVGLTEPPTEEHLLQNTLWPEVQKLYGHGYELFALAAHTNGKLLASACKASKLEHAAIILWNTDTWRQEQTLTSHQLTVTQLAFSPNGQFLLSVSRDRRWSLFQCDEPDSGKNYQLVASTDKKNGIHTRIIWTCAWTHDSLYFATGSRDGKVLVWSTFASPPLGSPALDFKGESVTALAFAPYLITGAYALAVGLSSGMILLYRWHLDSQTWKKSLQLDNNLAHHLSVKRLAFHPLDASIFASCGADHMFKIHKISIGLF